MSSATRNKKRDLIIVNFKKQMFLLSLKGHLSFVYLQKIYDVEINEDSGEVVIIPLDMRSLEREYFNKVVGDLWEMP